MNKVEREWKAVLDDYQNDRADFSDLIQVLLKMDGFKAPNNA